MIRPAIILYPEEKEYFESSIIDTLIHEAYSFDPCQDFELILSQTIGIAVSYGLSCK